MVKNLSKRILPALCFYMNFKSQTVKACRLVLFILYDLFLKSVLILNIRNKSIAGNGMTKTDSLKKGYKNAQKSNYSLGLPWL